MPNADKVVLVYGGYGQTGRRSSEVEQGKILADAGKQV